MRRHSVLALEGAPAAGKPRQTRLSGGRVGLASSMQILVYCSMTGRARFVEFRGTALADLRAFPVAARREAGFQLDRVQQGSDPDDWKPMNTIGAGVREIRIRDAAGAFRVIYVAKFAAAIYVLHCFQKRTQRTSKADLTLAMRRYRDLVQEMSK